MSEEGEGSCMPLVGDEELLLSGPDDIPLHSSNNPEQHFPKWFARLGAAGAFVALGLCFVIFRKEHQLISSNLSFEKAFDSSHHKYPKWSATADPNWDDEGGWEGTDSPVASSGSYGNEFGYGNVRSNDQDAGGNNDAGMSGQSSAYSGSAWNSDLGGQGSAYGDRAWNSEPAGYSFDEHLNEGWPKDKGISRERQPQPQPYGGGGYEDGWSTDGWGADGWSADGWSADGWHEPITTTTTTTVHFYPPRPKIERYVNQYNASNPLKIKVQGLRSRNYFLIIGDWGKAGGPGSCQLAVAARLREYVTEQKAAGKHLLFIGSVGDNFYWTGATPEAWERSWSQPYGANDPNSPLFRVPWLSVYGNHDFGNSDPHAFCPHLFPRKIVGGQPYSSHQLNLDKYPDRPHFTEHYWLPDYNYHYELPEANLEVIVVDTNAKVEPTIIGGEKKGRAKADEKCGGQATTQAFLQKLTESGEDLLRKRAAENKAGQADTVLIIQHYPGKCPRDIFENSLPPARKGKVKVLCAYGHDHNQGCDLKDKDGICINILTGGGGGCCAPLINTAGFTAVHLDDSAGVKSVDVESSSVRLPPKSCKW
eukprot:g20539.t1